MNPIKIIYFTDFSYSASTAFAKSITSDHLNYLRIEVCIIHMLEKNSNSKEVNVYFDNLRLDLQRSNILEEDYDIVLLQPNDFGTIEKYLNSGEYKALILGKNGTGNKNGNGSFLKKILQMAVNTAVGAISEDFIFQSEARAIVCLTPAYVNHLNMLNFFMHQGLSPDKIHHIQVLITDDFSEADKLKFEKVANEVFEKFKIECKYVTQDELLKSTNIVLQDTKDQHDYFIYFESGFLENTLVFSSESRVIQLNYLTILKFVYNDETIQVAKYDYEERLINLSKDSLD